MSYKVCDANGNPITRELPASTIPIAGSWAGNGRFQAYVDFLECRIRLLFDNVSPFDDDAYYGHVEVQAAANSGYNRSPSFKGPVAINVPPSWTDGKEGYGDLVTYSLNGSIEISGVILELRCDVGGSGWKDNVPDGGGFNTIRYFWYVRDGQSITATCDAGDLGHTAGTGTISGSEFTGSYSCGLNIERYAGGLAGVPESNIAAQPGKFEIQISYALSQSGEIAHAEDTYKDGFFSATAGAGSAYVLAQGAGNQDNIGAGADIGVQPDIPVCVKYHINALDEPYPDALQVQAILGGGTLATPIVADGVSGEFSAVQRDYTAGAGAGLKSDGKEEHTYGPVSLAITTDSIKAQGEDYVVSGYGVDTTPRITRLPFRGRKFPAIAVTHAESYGLPYWNDIDHWSASSGTTVTKDSNGDIVITSPSGSSGGATFTYPTDSTSGFHHAVSCLSYRFLNFTTPTGIASPAFSITIPPCSLPVWEPLGIGFPDMQDVYSGPQTPSKRWSVRANAHGLQDCGGDVDLCGPALVNFGEAYEPLSPMLPLDRGTRWPIPSRMMACQGVWRIEQLVLDSIPAGETLTISNLSLRRRNEPTYDGLDQWNRGVYSQGSAGPPPVDSLTPEWESGLTMPSSMNGDDPPSTIQIYERRGLLSIVDGKQAIEEAVFWYSLFEGSTGSVIHYFHTDSIAEIIGKINAADDEGIVRYPGVVATSLRPVTSDCASTTYSYGDDVKPDTCYYNETGAAAWLCNHDTSLGVSTDESTGIATMYARPLFDQITPCFWLNFNRVEPVFGDNPCDAEDWDDDWYWKQFEAIAVLRGSAQGLYLAATDKETPQAGIGFQMIETDDVPAGSAGSVRGSSVTSAPGFYSTGMPYGRGPNVSHKVVSTDTTPNVSIPFVGTDWRARYRHRATSCGDFSLCCTTQLGDPMTFSPFAPQFSDPSATPNEEWRRVGSGTGFGENAQATLPSASEEAENNEDAA